MRDRRLALALLSSTAGLALLASHAFGGEAEDLQARIDALRARIDQLERQAPPADTARDAAPANAARRELKNDYQLFPGADTSYAIHGYVKTDLLIDLNQTIGDTADWTAIQPNGSTAQRRGGPQFRIHSRESRITFETRTPSSYGQIHTYIQGDFLMAGGDQFRSNSSPFRLRHAFGELGPVLAGQYWSNFIDLVSFPETVDFNGPPGNSFVRQGQLRYTRTTGPWVLSASMENPQGDVAASNGATSAAPIPKAGTDPVNNIDRMPDITARAAYDQVWGHLALAGIVRRFETDNGGGGPGGPPGSESASAVGGGGLLGGVLHVAPVVGSIVEVPGWLAADDIGFTGFYGSGIGRYVNVGGGDHGSAVIKDFGTASVSEETQGEWGGFVWYQHHWSEEFRSNIVYANQRQHLSSVITPTSAAVAQGLSYRTQTLHMNIIWSPVDRVNFGFEGMWGEREFPKDPVTGLQQTGDAIRLQASAWYIF